MDRVPGLGLEDIMKFLPPEMPLTPAMKHKIHQELECYEATYRQIQQLAQEAADKIQNIQLKMAQLQNRFLLELNGWLRDSRAPQDMSWCLERRNVGIVDVQRL
jgi:hypothetical protein